MAVSENRCYSLAITMVLTWVSMAVGQIIKPDQIAKIVYLNDTTFVSYNSSSSKCRIDCADAETMAHRNFRTFQKIWMFNETDMFTAADKTFIDSNRSLEFQVLVPEDTGVYQCCVRSLDLAYQSFVCYSTHLTVIDDFPEVAGGQVEEGHATAEVVNATEVPLPPSWDVTINDGEIINARPANNYFVKMFEDNVTDIKCLVNEILPKISTNNNYPAPLYNDLFIHGFNVSEHSGLYVCNATRQISPNETLIETIQFTVSQSFDSNPTSTLLDDSIVREAIKNDDQGHLLTTTTYFLILPLVLAFQMF